MLKGVVAGDMFAIGYCTNTKTLVVIVLNQDKDGKGTLNDFKFCPFKFGILEQILHANASTGGYGCMLVTADSKVAKGNSVSVIWLQLTLTHKREQGSTVTKKSESTLGAILMDECLQLSFVMLQCFHFPCGSLCKFVSKLVL